MKYVYINIRNFIKNEHTIFGLVLLCVFCSAIIINFAFGFYHHLEQKKLDETQDMNSLEIGFHDNTKSRVTKGNLLEVLLQLDESVLNNCTISFEGKFGQDHSDNPAIDNSMLVEYLPFTLHNGKIGVALLEDEWKENAILKDGNYFSQAQMDNKELVCLASISKDYEGEEAKWAKKYSANEDGTYTVDGKQYTCIGHVDWFSIVPMVPITTVNDDCYIQRVSFGFSKNITKTQYTAIKNAITEAYDDLAEIPSLNIKEVDSMRFYNALLILCVFLIALSGIILSILYEYILLRRKRSLVIYRMCGMTQKKARLLYFTECCLVSVALYILAVLIFNFILLPNLCLSFEYIRESYSLLSYSILGAMYMGLTSLILFIMIVKQTKNNIVNELKEA